MLPPVPKLPATDASYATTASPIEPTKPVGMTAMPTDRMAEESTNSVFAKATIASLASEYQLSRSTFILSETLGKLMNIPRQDGEAIETYVARLADALRAMPAAQRAVLEQQVSKALQGLTLSMLAEVLKNPTGPDAARLALLIELSRYKGLDLAAKAVVSSYQQNNRTDVPPSQVQPSRMPDVQKPVHGGQPNSPVTSEAVISSPANRLVAQVFNQLTQLAAPMKEVIAARIALPEPSVKAVVQDADGVEQHPKSSKPDANAALPVRTTQPQQQQETAKPAFLSTRSDNTAKVENRQASLAGQNHEIAPRQRVEIRNAPNSTAAQTSPLVKEAESLLFTALTGKSLPATTGDGQTSPALVGTLVPEAQESQPKEKNNASMPAAPKPTAEAEPAAERPTDPAAVRTIPEAELKAAVFEQAASQSLVGALLAKEGTPLPFVSYPLANDEPESETPHRGHGPSSEGEAEDEAEEHGTQDELEERIAANDEAEEAAPDNGLDNMSDERAENYYLRMGGIA